MTDPKPHEERGEQPDEKWYDRTRYQLLLFAGGIALFVLFMGLILDWYIDPRTSTAKKDLVQALGLITAGVAGAVGIYFTWRSQRLTREAQEENQRNTQVQLEQARNELDITRRGQITERFTRAIDQLGGESREIVMGGIYSLERTAREDRDYHWPIMEVLTSYVRTRAPQTYEEQPEPFGDPTLAPAIQAVLTVIGRRSIYHSDVEYGPIDLADTNLRGATLRNANLGNADLGNANLEESNLLGANLEGANLIGANLEGAYLEGAQLSGANLEEANLLEAHLEAANLWQAKGLTQEDLERVIGDETTRLPEGLERPKSWSQDEDKKAD